MQTHAQALPDVGKQLVEGKLRGLGLARANEGQHLVGAFGSAFGTARAREQSRQAEIPKRRGQQIQKLAADTKGARHPCRLLSIDPIAADHLVPDLDEVPGVEERAAMKQGVLDPFGMKMQDAALSEEVRLGVVGMAGTHARTSLGLSSEFRRCLSPAWPGIRHYHAQPRQKGQPFAVGGHPARRGGRHNPLDSGASLVGQGSPDSSACLREKLVDERPQLKQIGHAKSGPPLSRQLIGVRGTQVRPLDGDTEDRPVRELQQNPLHTSADSAKEQREALTPEGMKGVGDQNAGIRRTVCSLCGA